MKVTTAQFRSALVELTAQLVGTEAFLPSDLQDAIAATAENTVESQAVARAFYHPASGRVDIAALLEKLVGVNTGAHVLTRQPNGRYLISVVE